MGKFSISNLNIVENTKNKTPKSNKGSITLQRIPNTEFLYLIFKSDIAKLKRMPFDFHISSRIVVILSTYKNWYYRVF
jgi:hypothetical protein